MDLVVVSEQVKGRDGYCAWVFYPKSLQAYIATLGLDYEGSDPKEIDGMHINIHSYEIDVEKQKFPKGGVAMAIFLSNHALAFDSSLSYMHNVISDFETDYFESFNKVMLLVNTERDECKRAVFTSKGQSLADEYGFVFFETFERKTEKVEDLMDSTIMTMIQGLAKTESVIEVMKVQKSKIPKTAKSSAIRLRSKQGFQVNKVQKSKIPKTTKSSAIRLRNKQGFQVDNALPKIADVPSKVEELGKTKGSMHSSDGDVWNRSSMEVTQKLNDVKISKEGDIASFESNKGFLCELEKRTPKRFSHDELKMFTSGFGDEVGSGAYGTVYKGRIRDSVNIAVKVLTMNDLTDNTFEVEVNMMFKTSHHNIVKFYGYCSDHNMKAIVYEYMENGSLDTILYGNPQKLEWQQFYKISIEIAKGLAYLHDNQIIHHDMKPANVLVNKNLSTKITDFGLARLIDEGVTHVTWSNYRGTKGYMAPELYLPSSKITFKCDVYSFGMMLFEILRMRRNSENSQWFPEQVWSKFNNGELDKILDECDIKEKDKENARLLSIVALWCTQFTAKARPSMSSVANILEEKLQISDPPNPYLPAPEKVSPFLCVDKKIPK